MLKVPWGLGYVCPSLSKEQIAVITFECDFLCLSVSKGGIDMIFCHVFPTVSPSVCSYLNAGVLSYMVSEYLSVYLASDLTQAPVCCSYRQCGIYFITPSYQFNEARITSDMVRYREEEVPGSIVVRMLTWYRC